MGELSSSGSIRLRFLDGCPEIPPPFAEDQVEDEFNEFLTSKSIEVDLREDLIAAEPLKSKWVYVFLSKLRGINTEEWIGARECVGLVQRLHGDTKCVRDLFLAIRLNALFRSSTWVETFVAEKGIEALLTPLKVSGGAPAEVCNEVLCTLFVFTNSPGGISAMSESSECCPQLCSIFGYSTNEIRARSLNLLRVLSRHSSMAQEMVLSTFSSNGSKEQSLQIVVAKLEQSQSDAPLLLAALRFINSLLESARGTKQRAVICDDLKQHGLLALLEPYQNRDERHAEDNVITSALIAQSKIFNDYYGETTKTDTLGALRLALGDAFSTVRSGTPTIDPATGNQNEENPETDEITGTIGESHVVNIANSTGSAEKQSRSDRSISSFENILNQLQAQTNNLDQETHDKLADLLQKITATLSDESRANRAVDRLHQSLASPQSSTKLEEKPSYAKPPPAPLVAAATIPGQEPDLLTRMSLALFPSLGEPSSVSKPPTSGKPTLFSGFGDFSFSSLAATTPAKNSVSRPSLTSFIGAENAASSLSRPSESPAGALKLSLPFFQSSKKGPGLGITPACTPIATASVRKDAKRPVFPSMPSPPRTEAPPALNSVESVPTKAPQSPALPPIDMTPELSPLKAVKPLEIKPDTNSNSSAVVAPPASVTDVSKFRKLLSMGAPREAVRAKMQQAGLNPDLLDEQQGFSPKASPKPTPAPEKAVAPTTTEIPACPDISKFRKLLSMGAPLAAVKAKMVQAGLDPELLDKKTTFPQAKDSPPVPPPPVETSSGPDLAKFKKLLAMGAPLAAVKSKMAQAGLDPNLLDGPSPTNVPVPAAAAVTVTKTLVKDDPNYAKFFKLRSMGAPAAAVKAKMVQAGLDSNLLDTPDAELPTKNTSSIANSQADAAPNNPAVVLSATQPEEQTKVKDDPQYAKFFKLLSMGAPAESVKAKMRMAGLQPGLLDTPDASLKPASSAPKAAEPQVKVKDDPAYAKFFKLLSMGAPAESVKAKMRMAGLQPELLETPEAPVPTANASAQPPVSAVKVKDDPAYAKFFKLLSMGAPAESVKVKMQMAGLKPELLDTPEAELPNTSDQVSAQPQVKVKDDPAYAKFFKLLEMGAPAESVKAKMRMAGLQGDLLDTPDAVVPSAAPPTQPTAPTPTNTAARRAHLSIAIKPVVKTKTRAFYWQRLKAEVITGTVWEELEQEQSNQSNQDLLTLSESELEQLETEFPPPVASGPSTGTRRNMIGSPLSGPGSPMAGPGSPTTSPRVVFLIDRARSNNISIIVKQFRMSNAALRVAIMKMDSEVLTLDRVLGLIKILPTEEEIALIAGFKGDPTTLNGAELVLKELITVPRLKQRLAALETKHQFPGLIRDLQTKVNKIRTACNDIAQSSDFKTILLVILQVGNKMNQGTARGEAKGFRLNDLIKLAQLKSIDRSVTLLHYVARMVRKKKGDVVRLGDSLSSLYDVQSIPIPELQGDMNRVGDLTESINVELAAQRLKNRIEAKEDQDMFVESMTEFVETASKAVTTVKEELDEVLKLLRDTMLRFDKDTETDENPAPTPASSDQITPANLAGAGEFFSIIYEFTLSITKADRENELKRIREEKRLKQQELRAATPRRPPSAGRSPFVKSSSSNDKAVGPETQEAPQSKNGSAEPSRAEAPNNPVTTRSEDAVKALTQPSSSAPETRTSAVGIELMLPAISKKPQETQSAMKDNEIQPGQKAATLTEVGKSRPSGIPKAPLRTPGKVVKSSVLPRFGSPLKKSSVVPGIPSPGRQFVASPSSIEKSKLTAPSTETAVPFDAASIGEIKVQLETKHATNNDTQRSRLKPEVETETEDHNNNNSEPTSPEKALSEAEPAARVVIQTDA